MNSAAFLFFCPLLFGCALEGALTSWVLVVAKCMIRLKNGELDFSCLQMVWPNECHSTPFFQSVILTSEEYLHRATRVSHDVNWTRVLLKRWQGCLRYPCHAWSCLLHCNLPLQSIAHATASSCQSGSYRDLQGQVSSLLHHIASSLSDHPSLFGFSVVWEISQEQII